MLDLTDLGAFVRIADLKSVSAAARATRTPKSSVSRSLARLEAAVGSRLVERSVRSLRLTDAGALLLPYAQRILNDVDEAEVALGSFTGAPRGALRVNLPFTVAQTFVGPMLPAFLAKYPDVRVLLDVENRNADLFAQRIDLAIRVGPLAASALVARKLPVVPMWLCASRAYLRRRGTPRRVADLAAHDVIARVDGNATWTFFTPEVEHVTITPRAVVPDPAILLPVLLGGAGIGRLPRFVAARPVAEGRLVRLLPKAAQKTLDMHALYPSHRSLSAKVRVFIDALVAHLGGPNAPDGALG